MVSTTPPAIDPAINPVGSPEESGGTGGNRGGGHGGIVGVVGGGATKICTTTPVLTVGTDTPKMEAAKLAEMSVGDELASVAAAVTTEATTAGASTPAVESGMVMIASTCALAAKTFISSKHAGAMHMSNSESFA